MPTPVNPPCAPLSPGGCPDPGLTAAALPAILYAGGQAPVTRMLARLARPRLVPPSRGVPAQAGAPLGGESVPPEPDDALATIDHELAQLFAARELYMAWVQAARAEGGADLNPATFLRAWCDSTGRVIQLLRARRDLGGGDGADALLDAVYAELELQLPAISITSASAELDVQLPAISGASECAAAAPVAPPATDDGTADLAAFRNREPA